MAKRFSKLQQRLYNIVDPKLNFQIHYALYEMNSNNGYHGNKLTRCFITIGKDIVFDYPKNTDYSGNYGIKYAYDPDISDISVLIDEYIECSLDNIMNQFENDKWGITDILRVCDRRIGKRRLQKIKDNTSDPVLLDIINKRL